MDLIESMGVLAKVIEKQSFSGAARELRLSQAAVSKHVRALEDWLGARLLDRTTRRLNVTEIGALVYERCERILDEIDEVGGRDFLEPRPRVAEKMIKNARSGSYISWPAFSISNAQGFKT